VGLLPAPPHSLTRCWDRARWHYEAASFPRELGEETAKKHIVACLRFLDERGVLTAAGKKQREQGDAIVDAHVRAAARAFLDETYDAYLALTEYGKKPPVNFLSQAWKDYAARFDLNKRARPDGYLALLLDVPGRTLGDLLWEMRTSPERVAQLDAVRSMVPEHDRALVDATLSLNRGDTLKVVETHEDSPLVLHALRYLVPSRRRALGYRAAIIAATRLRLLEIAPGTDDENLAALARALTLELGARDEETAWSKLGASDRKKLKSAAATIRRAAIDLPPLPFER
jgi:hypothetical protein